MPRIATVDWMVARVPLDRETAFATRSVTHRDYLLVRLRSAEGAEGVGFCYAGHKGGRIPALVVEELLAPLLLGEDSTATERLWARMYQECLLLGRAGAVMRAISALDVALWDLNARAAGLPLWAYLGAGETESVPAYASGGYYLEGKTPERLGEEVAGFAAAGFKAVKIKVGRLTPSEEGERIRAARAAIGPDVLLMLDANNAWPDLPTALAYMRVLEPEDPYWIEEPFSPDDIDNHARLARHTPVLVATGEIEYGRWRHQELLAKEAAAILQTDAAVCGGITEWRKIAGMAAGHGVTLCPHWFHDLHVHLVAATPHAQFVEYFADDQVLNFRKLVNSQLETRDGRLLLPRAPGLGFGFDEQAVQRFALVPWSNGA